MSPHEAGSAPSPWIVRFAPRIPKGPVLDLACGGGRHLRWLMSRGHSLVGIDRDLAGVADLSSSGAELIAADLESGGPWPLGQRRFAGVIVTNYLWRPLLPHIVASVAAGGVLIYETFALGNERFGKPSNPDFLLKPGELLEAVRGHLAVIAYEHLTVEEPRPAVIQHIAAMHAVDPAAL
jgi:SAM-dependent methyltransferase